MADSEFNLDHWPHFAPFQISYQSEPLSMQVTSGGQFCAALSPMFSEVAILHLNLDLDEGRWQLGQEDEIDDAVWHDLLRPFCSVDKLQVDAGLIGRMSLAPCRNDNGPGSSVDEGTSRAPYAHPTGLCALWGRVDRLIAARRNIGLLITKRRRPPITAESDGEGEMEEEVNPEIGVEELEVGSKDANPDVELDDSVTGSVLESSTELNSGSDYDAEFTINVIHPRLLRFALFS